MSGKMAGHLLSFEKFTPYEEGSAKSHGPWRKKKLQSRFGTGETLTSQGRQKSPYSSFKEKRTACKRKKASPGRGSTSLTNLEISGYPIST